MAKQKREPLRIHLTPIVEANGMAWVIEQLGVKQVVEQLGIKQVIKHLGPKRVIDEMGGVKQLLAALTPSQLQEMKQLLQE